MFKKTAIDPKIPEGHKKYNEEEKKNCPYYQMQNDQSKKNETKDNIKEKKKIKKSKGGCPFMPSGIFNFFFNK